MAHSHARCVRQTPSRRSRGSIGRTTGGISTGEIPNMKLQIQEIVIDPEYSIRLPELCGQVVDDYSQRLSSLPPVTVWDHKGKYILLDGLHRIHAHKKLGQLEIEVEF